MRSEDGIEDIWKQHKKAIDDYALEMYHKVRIRWEEMNLENDKTDTLIKARDFIQKELNSRLRNITNERNN